MTWTQIKHLHRSRCCVIQWYPLYKLHIQRLFASTLCCSRLPFGQVPPLSRAVTFPERSQQLGRPKKSHISKITEKLEELTLASFKPYKISSFNSPLPVKWETTGSFFILRRGALQESSSVSPKGRPAKAISREGGMSAGEDRDELHVSFCPCSLGENSPFIPLASLIFKKSVT